MNGGRHEWSGPPGSTATYCLHCKLVRQVTCRDVHLLGGINAKARALWYFPAGKPATTARPRCPRARA